MTETSLYIKRTFTRDTYCQTVKTITNTLEETKRLYLLHRFWRHSILALFTYQKLCNFLGKGSSCVKIQMLIMLDTSTQFPFLSLKLICLCVCPVVHVFESWCGICQIFLGPFPPHPTVHLFVRTKCFMTRTQPSLPRWNKVMTWFQHWLSFQTPQRLARDLTQPNACCLF